MPPVPPETGNRKLETASLSVHLGDRQVLSGVSFAAANGHITAIIGPNGAGKSTLLRAILGLVPSQGAIMLDGGDVRALDQRERARRIAWVPQRSKLAAAMSVENVVASGRYAHRGLLSRLSARDQAAIDEALDATDARALAQRRFDQLSCGEQQRVLLARALATGAGTILLDEPTAGLDLGHVLSLHAVLRRLASTGRCVVVVLHQLDEVRAVADRVVLLVDGSVAATGAPNEVLTAECLRSVYGVEAMAGGGWRLTGTSP